MGTKVSSRFQPPVGIAMRETSADFEAAVHTRQRVERVRKSQEGNPRNSGRRKLNCEVSSEVDTWFLPAR
jgi:hypothetical protein